VITKIDSKDFTSLASFTVPVPLSPLNEDILSPIVLGGIIAAILVAAVLLWMKRKKSVN
jgi:LPXTG-motif cell wall-anchored protein